MRISDWSSDVCSSDLVDAVGGQKARGFGFRHQVHVQAQHHVGVGRLAFQAQAAQHRDRVVDGDEVQVEAAQIGRASGRERVCQSVSIAVAAVSIKNKADCKRVKLQYECKNDHT